MKSRVKRTKPMRVLVQPESAKLWDAICVLRGWKYTEAAHRIAADYAERNGIDAKPSRRPVPS